MPAYHVEELTNTVVSYPMHQMDALGALSARANARVIDGSLPFCLYKQVRTLASIGDICHGYDCWGFGENNWAIGRAIVVEGGLALVTRSKNNREPHTGFTVWGTSEHVAHEILAELLKRAPEIPPVEDNDVDFNFWMKGPRGGLNQVERRMPAPTWDEIAHNYPMATSDAVDRLMRMTQAPDMGGKLLLLYGPPGTGKTHTIRALAREWREWCSVHYVVDPESLFTDATYLMQGLMDTDEDDDRWRLLILEDTDEFLVADAKDRTGQALSRLLNIADGILGQGMKVLILITTNEETGNLHPAIKREGRCLANISFDLFEPSAARVWLGQNGFEGKTPIVDKQTLAQLFNKLRELQAQQISVEIKSDNDRVGTYL